MRGSLRWVCVATALVALLTGSFAFGAETVWLTSLDLSKMRQGWGKPQLDRSIRETPLSIGGKRFARGVGTHANSVVWIDLAGGSERFLASVGVDDAAGGPGSVTFKIIGDGRKLWESGVMKPGQAAKPVDVDLKGVQCLLLTVGDAGDGVAFDHADWADARFIVAGAKPKTISRPREEAVILTPKPGPAPRINGPEGLRLPARQSVSLPHPDARASGPSTFAPRTCPTASQLDAADRHHHAARSPGAAEYVVTLKAANAHGTAERPFKIVCGDTLALTPPMGWNHWYAHYDRVTDKMMREAADAMVASGMADVGYQYVNIDDCWMNAPKHERSDARRPAARRSRATSCRTSISPT